MDKYQCIVSCSCVALLIAILVTARGCAETELALKSGYEQVVDPESRQILWKKAQ